MATRKKTYQKRNQSENRMVQPKTAELMDFEQAWSEVSKSYMIGQLRHARPIAETLYKVLKGESNA